MKDESENIFVDRICRFISPYMDVKREVWSSCGLGRIDLLVECKITQARFGIECKRHDRKRGEEIGEFIRQAMRYSQMIFNGEKIPIFLAPPLSNEYLALVDNRIVIEGKEYITDRHSSNHSHHTVNGILGDFNIGEFRKVETDYPYFVFMFSNKPIFSFKKSWDDELRKFSDDKIEGLHKPNYTALIRSINFWKL